MILNWYGKSFDLAEFIKVILQSLDRVHDSETLRHVGYVLESSGAITLQNFASFCATPTRIFNLPQSMPHAIAMTNRKVGKLLNRC